MVGILGIVGMPGGKPGKAGARVMSVWTGVDSPIGGVAPVRCSEDPLSLTLEVS
jgi:hypothetical protein